TIMRTPRTTADAADTSSGFERVLESERAKRPVASANEPIAVAPVAIADSPRSAAATGLETAGAARNAAKPTAAGTTTVAANASLRARFQGRRAGALDAVALRSGVTIGEDARPTGAPAGRGAGGGGERLDGGAGRPAGEGPRVRGGGAGSSSGGVAERALLRWGATWRSRPLGASGSASRSSISTGGSRPR